MTKAALPLQHAYYHLLDLARADAYGSQPQLFALTWLAAAKMVLEGTAGASVESLALPSTWTHLTALGFPTEAVDRAGVLRSQDVARRAQAAGVVAELSRALGGSTWDVLPLLVDSTLKRPYEVELAVLPQLATFLIDLIGHPSEGKELWIPFDGMGQLAIEALRRGWTVRTVSPLGMSQLPLELLLVIETGRVENPNVLRDVAHTPLGGASLRTSHVLAMPPFGMPTRNSRLAHWDTTGAIDNYARSESWAVHEFLNRATERAIFVVPPGVLFARGQEERLRGYLLHRAGERNELEAVVALPTGAFAAAPALGGAIIIMNPGQGHGSVQMVDLAGGRRSVSETAEILHQEHERVMSGGPSAGRVAAVTRDEIAANENSLAPSRYLRRVADLGESRKLGDLCEAIRPPSLAKEETPHLVYEVGAQDLNAWRPLDRPSEKAVHLRIEPKPNVLLRPGDIVLSVKGTVGKAAIVGAAAERQQLVSSQSCLVLRLPENIRAQNFSPEYLLMYLRSPHGEAQLQGLQVGTGVQHISPATLLSAAVPVPSQKEYAAVSDDFYELCRLEEERGRLEEQMSDIRHRRWAVVD